MFVEQRRYKSCYVDKYDSAQENIVTFSSVEASDQPDKCPILNLVLSASFLWVDTVEILNEKSKIFLSPGLNWQEVKRGSCWKDRQGSVEEALFTDWWVLGKLSLSILAVWILAWLPWTCASHNAHDISAFIFSLHHSIVHNHANARGQVQIHHNIQMCIQKCFCR